MKTIFLSVTKSTGEIIFSSVLPSLAVHLFNKYLESNMFNGVLIISLTLLLLISIPIYEVNTRIIPTYKVEVCRDLEAFLSCVVVGEVSFSNSRCQVLIHCYSTELMVPWQPKLEHDCLSVNIETISYASYQTLLLILI